MTLRPHSPQRPRPEQQDELIYVWCTTHIRTDTLDRFFLVADNRWLYGRKVRLAFVRNDDTQNYNPQHVDLRKNKPLIVPQSDLPPGASEDISIQLDEHSASDRSSCLLKINGRENVHKFGEVRCYWETALQLCFLLRHGKTNLWILQCLAALNGGLVPSPAGGRHLVTESNLSPELTRRPMPPVQREYPDELLPCAVFLQHKVRYKVVRRLIDQVNLTFADDDYRMRLTVMSVDKENDTYQFLDDDPFEVSQLDTCFVGLSFASIRRFVASKFTEGDVNPRYFIILDKLTDKRLPGMDSKAFERRSGRWLNCVIGDTECKESGGPLALRCTFDSLADILDRLKEGASLRDFVNEAASDHRGLYSHSTAPDGTVLFPETGCQLSVLKESDPPNSQDVTVALANMQRVVANYEFTGSPSQYPAEMSQPDFGEHNPSPMPKNLQRAYREWRIKNGFCDAPEVETAKRRRSDASPSRESETDYGDDFLALFDQLDHPKPFAPQPSQSAAQVQHTKATPHIERFYDSGIGSSSAHGSISTFGSSQPSRAVTVTGPSRANSEYPTPTKRRKVEYVVINSSDSEEDADDEEDEEEENPIDELYDIRLADSIMAP
ncbi:hypothetical protein HDK64DRAFT_284818 [Phyllosticta capitalensis]|uniref:Uncharacterized protein n=1 Tax=Phyllosticta capitalensis TaxID=121624 RepID=A0ABR1Y8V5_9PEZI